MVIDSPEAVVEHMERVLFGRLEKAAAELDPADEAKIAEKIAKEVAVQEFFGPDMLKPPYGGEWAAFPSLRYTQYGYEHYFMAYALYPEVMERCFRLHADLAVRSNRRAVAAIRAGALPAMVRLDHDMADARGTLVSIGSLDRLWLPHCARAIEPLVTAGVRLVWHCDGNLMEMVPRLIEAGVGGFQGFQYECGMDYPAICRMRDRDGGPLVIWAGVSVTTTLPHGTPQDVRRELAWLVEHGPPAGLFLGVSSSVVPNTNRDNIRTLLEGLRHYRERGRG
jgi:uroporphyrinogen decarboxylase